MTPPPTAHHPQRRSRIAEQPVKAKRLIVPIAVTLLPRISSLLRRLSSPTEPCRRTRNLLRCRARLSPREQDNIRRPRSRPTGGDWGVTARRGPPVLDRRPKMYYEPVSPEPYCSSFR